MPENGNNREKRHTHILQLLNAEGELQAVRNSQKTEERRISGHCISRITDRTTASQTDRITHRVTAA